MKRFRSTYVLWAFMAVLVAGFYTVDFQSKQASIFSLPDFSPTSSVEKSESAPSKTISELNDAIVDIADKAKSTVVTVTVTQTVEARHNPLAQFFGDPRQEPEKFERQGLGSGVIVSEDGYILTNNHVIEEADEVEIQLYNDKRYKAEVIGTDPRTDIAVLKISTDENLDVIKLGNSESARVGEMVLAIGSPLQPGLAHSVSMGIVSAKDRSIGILEERGGYENFIQTDAAINPGNSGGALINMDGELIGINSAIASRSGGSDGIGFAVPTDIAKRVMKSIIENGRVIRGYLGITRGGQVDDTMARALGLNKAYGVIVGAVEDDGPAARAGIREGDVIQTINGKPVRDFGSLRTAVATSSPGTEVKLGINRDGDQKTFTVTLGELPQEMTMNREDTPEASMEKKLGFRVQDITPEIAQKLNLEQGQDGVVVVQLSRRSEAFRQGLRQGDVITEVDRKPVSDVSDFNQIMNDLVEQENDVVLLRVIAAGTNNSELIAFEL